MTILNPKIENGCVTGTAFDKYDFEFLYKDYIKDFRTSFINNSAAGFQTIKRLNNYYIFVPIKVKF